MFTFSRPPKQLKKPSDIITLINYQIYDRLYDIFRKKIANYELTTCDKQTTHKFETQRFITQKLTFPTLYNISQILHPIENTILDRLR